MTYSRKDGAIGIYKITNKLNNKAYIGQSRNVNRRWREHCSNQGGSAISAAIQKYGEENFDFQVLEECSIVGLDEKEKFYIEKFNTYGKGYNLSTGGSGPSMSGKSLNIEEVTEITKLLTEGKTFQELGSQFNVSAVSISKINSGETWTREGISYPIREDRSMAEDIGRERLLKEIAVLGFHKVGEKYGYTGNGVKHWCKILDLPENIKDIQILYGNYHEIEVYSPSGELLEYKTLDDFVDYIFINKLSSASKNNIRNSARRAYMGVRKSYLGYKIIKIK